MNVTKTTVGYVVAPVGYQAMEMVEQNHATDEGLYFGSVATVFPTRARARRAIRVTLKRVPDFEQKFGELRVSRLVAEG